MFRFQLLLGFLVLAALVEALAVAAGRSWLDAAWMAAPVALVVNAAAHSARYSARFLPGMPPAMRVVFVLSTAVGGGALAMGAAAAGVWSAGSPVAIGALYPTLFATGMLFFLVVSMLYQLAQATEQARQWEQREAEARVMAREAELRALKAQVNPHFLFNSLHSISALTSADAGRARAMCIQLADFLRSTLGLGEKQSVALGEELDLLRKYLAVEQVRYGSRLQVREEVEDQVLGCQVPPLLLQPLVENSIRHGVATVADEGWVRLSAAAAGRHLQVVVENTYDPDAPVRRGAGLGLKNVESRLRARFGEAARLRSAGAGGVWQVRIWIPMERERA
ncbi:MAG TPA: sensor histidine kinase [Solibacterales bacterium]|nr:sensor histidine kinase [Bryobacterales bacterium]